MDNTKTKIIKSLYIILSNIMYQTLPLNQLMKSFCFKNPNLGQYKQLDFMFDSCKLESNCIRIEIPRYPGPQVGLSLHLTNSRNCTTKKGDVPLNVKGHI